MALQFNCSSCGRPIEVDDELARRQVTCPYCRRVVTAPAADSAGVAAEGPAVISGSDAALAPMMPAAEDGPAPPTNWPATVALLCAAGTVLCFAAASVIVARIAFDVAPDGDITTHQSEIQERFLHHPAAVLLELGVLVFALGGLVLSIIGLRRGPSRKWQALVGLAVCGLITAYGCVVTIASVLAGGSAGG